MSAFTAEQLQALALMFLKLNAYAFDIYLVFFGLWCVLIGYLIFRSTFLPRVLGVLFYDQWFGLGDLSVPAARKPSVFPFVAAVPALGEIPLELWLIMMGVNVQR